MAAGSSGLFHGCRHQIAVPGPRAAFSDAARNTLLGPLAPSGLQAQHWAARAQLGSLPTPPLAAACKPFWLEGSGEPASPHPTSPAVFGTEQPISVWYCKVGVSKVYSKSS